MKLNLCTDSSDCLRGLALDIYRLVAIARTGAMHTELKDSIRKAEATMREFLNKLGKGFRKALRPDADER